MATSETLSSFDINLWMRDTDTEMAPRTFCTNRLRVAWTDETANKDFPVIRLIVVMDVSTTIMDFKIPRWMDGTLTSVTAKSFRITSGHHIMSMSGWII